MNLKLSIALLLAMIFSVHISAANTVSIDSIEYCLYSDNTAEVKTNNYKQREVVNIPATIQVDGQDYTVTSILDRAFFNNSMTSLTLPNTVTAIGEKAFYGCNKLTALDLPSSVTILKESAFEKCSSIASLTLSSSLKSIPERLFYECASIPYVTVPSSVGFIGKAAFYSCESLQSISIPESVDSIGMSAFYGCNVLKTVTIPASVRKIEERAFWNCYSLESVTISPAVEEIKLGTFYGCHSLTNVVLPPSLTTIGERAFEQCLNLPLIIIPSTVTTIKEDAFKNCELLTTIVSLPTVPPAIERNVFYRVPENAIVYIPAGTLGLYPISEGWNAFYDFRELGTIDLTLSNYLLNLKVNETATLTVSVETAIDVTILSKEWTTSNPEVATVYEGVITAVGEGNATISYIVIDGTGCPHVVSCEIYVDGVAGIDGISSDDNHNAPIEYYNLNGVRVNPESLAPGLYIKKSGKRSVKVLIK